MTEDDLRPYLNLMEIFNSGVITASQFEERYMELFKHDDRIFPDNIFIVLNDLFSDADLFVSDPRIRGQDDLDESQLLASSKKAYSSLISIFGQPG